MQRLLGEQLTPREISEVVREADVNGDGTVDFEGDVVAGQPPWEPTSSSPCDFLQVGHSSLFSEFELGWGWLGVEDFVPALSAQACSKGSVSVIPGGSKEPFA